MRRLDQQLIGPRHRAELINAAENDQSFFCNVSLAFNSPQFCFKFSDAIIQCTGDGASFANLLLSSAIKQIGSRDASSTHNPSDRVPVDKHLNSSSLELMIVFPSLRLRIFVVILPDICRLLN
jgi:hypothetical protein